MVVVDNLYADPDKVRAWALRQEFYTPYEDPAAVRAGTAAPSWWASRPRSPAGCPFKSSRALLDCLERAVGERIDLRHWTAACRTLPDGRPAPAPIGAGGAGAGGPAPGAAYGTAVSTSSPPTGSS